MTAASAALSDIENVLLHAASGRRQRLRRHRREMLEALGQGSWLLDGRLPPYLRRAADQGLLRALTAQAHRPGRLLVIDGPPKSGKTRTVAETVLRDPGCATIWWFHPTWRILDRVHPDVSSRGDIPDALTVVLDDFHRCAPRSRPGASSVARAIRWFVAADATVILIRTVEQLQQHHDPTIGVGALRSFPPDETLWIPSALTDREHQRVPNEVVELATRHELSVVRLGEALAAGDVLRARWNHALVDRHHPHRCALVAALGAAISARPGEPIPVTMMFRNTRQAFEVVAPTRRWSSVDYRNALDWALDPIGGPGSQFAILTRRADGHFVVSALLRG